MKIKTHLIAIVFLVVGCGIIDEKPAPAYCHLGLACLFKNKSDIPKSKIDFTKYKHEVPPIGYVQNSLAVMGLNEGSEYVINRHNKWDQDDIDQYYDDGWQIGIRILTKYGHSLYIDDCYPVDDNVLHIEAIETTGKFKIFQIEIKMVDQSWVIMDGFVYRGVEVDYIVAFKLIK